MLRNRPLSTGGEPAPPGRWRGSLWATAILYFLEKNDLWKSLKQSVKLSLRHLPFLFSIAVVLAIYCFIFNLFVPAGNYYFMFLDALASSYLTTLTTIAVFFFYKDHYKIALPVKGSIVKTEKMSKGFYWGRFVAYVLLAELNIFF